jgi:hypothetical protein
MAHSVIYERDFVFQGGGMTNRINNCCAPHLLADVASLFGSEFVAKSHGDFARRIIGINGYPGL